MEEVGWTRTIYDQRNGVFVWVGLDPEEQVRLLNDLRDTHLHILRECLEDADETLREFFGKATPANTVRLAERLLERRAPHVFSLYQELLGRKIHAMKNGGDNHD